MALSSSTTPSSERLASESQKFLYPAVRIVPAGSYFHIYQANTHEYLGLARGPHELADWLIAARSEPARRPEPRALLDIDIEL